MSEMWSVATQVLKASQILENPHQLNFHNGFFESFGILAAHNGWN